MFNNHYDPESKFLSYTHSTPVNKGEIPPDYSLRAEEKPEIKKGFWPCLNKKKTSFAQIEDRRGEEGYVNGEAFTIIELGPYPEGWSITPPPSPPPTPDELERDFSAGISRRLDTFAAEKKYDSMTSARLAAFTEEFAEDGKTANKAYAETWDAALPMVAALRSGEISVEAALAQLPPLAWPA